MVKVYEIQSSDFEQVKDKEEIYQYFMQKVYVQMDTETFRFTPHGEGEALMCVQLGDFDNQFVISPDHLYEFKALLEQKIILAHNAKFDLRFLYHHNIWPRKIWDTFLAESVLTCGRITAKRGLAAVAKKRLEVDLDKSVRDKGWKQGLTREVIQYSADDVKYLEQIMHLQIKDLQRAEMLAAAELENQFVPCLAYIEYCGFTIDRQLWLQKMQQDQKIMQDFEQKLDDFILENNHTAFIDQQLDLFSTERTTTISWASPKQVVSFFEHLGIPTLVFKDGKMVHSVDAKHISKHKKKYPFVSTYLDYKGAEKVVSTYGQSFINQINPFTDRLHTSFKQMVDTSRLSSGGKNKETREEYINFQNIPATPDKKEREEGRIYERECFRAAPGNKLVVCDYSGQEQVVLANRSLEPKLLEFYDQGLGDMHAFVAQKMNPELEGLTLSEIKDNHKEKRQEAKIAGFAINYGGVGQTIADQLNKDLETGNRVYEAYFKAFPGLAAYFNKKRAEGLKNGFILISEETGRKYYIENFERYQILKREINSAFWERWKTEKRKHLKGETTEYYLQMKEKIKEFFKIKGDIERKSLNYPIQGTSAEITKKAGVYFFDWIVDNNYQGKVLIPNCVHDEYVAEAPEGELSELTRLALQESMRKAGKIYCKRVELKADATLCDIWEK